MEEGILNKIFDVFEDASKDEHSGRPKAAVAKFRTFIALFDSLKASEIGRRNPEGIIDELEEAAKVARNRVRVLEFYEDTIPLGAVTLDTEASAAARMDAVTRSERDGSCGIPRLPEGAASGRAAAASTSSIASLPVPSAAATASHSSTNRNYATPTSASTSPRPSFDQDTLREALSRTVASPAMQSKIQKALDETVFTPPFPTRSGSGFGGCEKGSTMLTCARCGKPGRFHSSSAGSGSKLEARALDLSLPPLLRCGRCKEVFYCNAECQKADWSRHKARCTTKKAPLATNNGERI